MARTLYHVQPPLASSIGNIMNICYKLHYKLTKKENQIYQNENFKDGNGKTKEECKRHDITHDDDACLSQNESRP